MNNIQFSLSLGFALRLALLFYTLSLLFVLSSKKVRGTERKSSSPWMTFVEISTIEFWGDAVVLNNIMETVIIGDKNSVSQDVYRLPAHIRFGKIFQIGDRIMEGKHLTV